MDRKYIDANAPTLKYYCEDIADYYAEIFAGRRMNNADFNASHSTINTIY